MNIKRAHPPKFLLGTLTLGALVFIGISIHLRQPVGALSGFRSERIIDDSIMLKTDQNTTASIQSFLDNSGPAFSVATCLRNFSEGGYSAATIISNAANSAGINAQVLLALIETETGLVTEPSPTAAEFSTVLGYPNVTTFTGQLNQAATTLADVTHNNNGQYQSGISNTIPWNTNSNCSTSQLTIESNATAALYSYPSLGYRANTAAITNDPLQGDSCSSYGIRNFYAYFSQWFGSPLTGGASLAIIYVHRFGNMPDNTHFWTVDTYEKDSMVQNGYRYEGSGWRVSNTVTPYPVYRLYNPAIRQHLFTLDPWEVHILTTSAGWTDEGIAWYSRSQGSPVYRLYSPLNHEHFYTSDPYERSVLISQGTFKDEGLAWRQP
jgi:hypothetical protein